MSIVESFDRGDIDVIYFAADLGSSAIKAAQERGDPEAILRAYRLSNLLMEQAELGEMLIASTQHAPSETHQNYQLS